MRTIKFKGLRTDGKGWVYGGYFQHTPDEDGVRYYIFDFNEGAVEVIPESVGQFTGLHDKNGKEIYEGDLIDFGNSNPVEVKFDNGSFNVFNEPLGWDFDSEEIPIKTNFQYCEIIGNVFENPDLVKL